MKVVQVFHTVRIVLYIRCSVQTASIVQTMKGTISPYYSFILYSFCPHYSIECLLFINASFSFTMSVLSLNQYFLAVRCLLPVVPKLVHHLPKILETSRDVYVFS